MDETWLVFCKNERYEISSYGNVRNKESGNARKLCCKGENGRLRWEYMKASKRHHNYVDVNVAEMFLGKCPDNHRLNHKDRNLQNNKVDNLEYIPCIKDETDEWKSHPIPEFAESYQVSINGQVRNSKTGRIKKLILSSTGYLRVSCDLGKFKGKEGFDVHCLIALAFIGPRPDKYVVNHKDGVKTNNRVDNLEYCTASENSLHAHSTGLCNQLTKKNAKEYIDKEQVDRAEEFSTYKVTSDGRVFNKKYTELYQDITSAGYKRVGLTIEGKRKNFYVHRLVAILYLDNANEYDIVNHKDGNKGNNCVDSLEWCSASHNTKHSVTELKKGTSRKVRQMDAETGKEIAMFNSIKEASQRTGVANTSIIHVCAGRYRTAKGFLWEYIND